MKRKNSLLLLPCPRTLGTLTPYLPFSIPLFGGTNNLCRQVPDLSLLNRYQRRKTAIGHSFKIKRRIPRYHRILYSRISHNRGIYLVSILSRPKNNPGKNHSFPFRSVSNFPEGKHIFNFQIIPDTFVIFQRAVFFPDFARLLCYFLIFFDIFL